MSDYRWLVSSDAEPWLELAATNDSLTARTRRLRKSLSPGRTHRALEQAELRVRARDKFARADRLFFTRQQLEQATDERLANYKASRFPPGHVADLCCGIGGDLMSLAARGGATGIDKDEIAVVLAKANLERSSARAEVVVRDVRDFDPRDVVAWHIDPDRRDGGRRSSQLAFSEPGMDEATRLLAACSNGAIKLAPAAEVPAAWRSEAELEWLGSRGECRQLVVWHGSLAATPGGRAATVVGRETHRIVGTPAELPLTDRIGRFVYEPENAVLAAGLANVLAEDCELDWLASQGGYLTGDRQVAHGLLSGFEITDVLPFDRRQWKSLLRTRRIGRLEIKKRGVADDPADIRRSLELAGDDEATLLLTNVNGRVVALLARRVKERSD